MAEKPQTGLLLKRHPVSSTVRWSAASLREAGLDSEGYYLKVDGTGETDEPRTNREQLYLLLSENDVVLVVARWKQAVKERGSNYAKECLRDALKE